MYICLIYGLYRQIFLSYCLSSLGILGYYECVSGQEPTESFYSKLSTDCEEGSSG